MASLRSQGVFELARRHGKRRSNVRWGRILIFLLLLGLIGTGVGARFKLTLIPPHVAVKDVVVLTPARRAQLDDVLDFERPMDRDQAIDFALTYTGQALSLSLSHPTSSTFDVGSRKGNCAEYALLFAAVFEVAAKKAGSSAHAVRVHSPLRVFDRVVPLASLREHDWILVYDPADGARIFLDPTLSDVWLGASLARNVRGGGSIDLPK